MVSISTTSRVPPWIEFETYFLDQQQHGFSVFQYVCRIERYNILRISCFFLFL